MCSSGGATYYGSTYYGSTYYGACPSGGAAAAAAEMEAEAEAAALEAVQQGLATHGDDIEEMVGALRQARRATATSPPAPPPCRHAP